MVKSVPFLKEPDWMLRDDVFCTICEGFLLDSHPNCGGGIPNASQYKETGLVWLIVMVSLFTVTDGGSGKREQEAIFITSDHKILLHMHYSTLH